MSLLTNLSAGQINTIPMDLAGNKTKIIKAVELAVDHGCGVVLFPELVLSGAGCAHLFKIPAFVRKCQDCLVALTKELPAGAVVGLGLPLLADNGRIYNAYAVIRRGEILGLTVKYLYKYDNPLDDSYRYFANTTEDVSCTIEGKTFYVASRSINCRGFTLGVAYDDWPVGFTDCDVVVIPNATPFELGSLESNLNQALNLSRDINAIVVKTNLLGCESGTLVYDGQGIIAQKGKLIAKNSPFSFKRENIVCEKCGIALDEDENDLIVKAISLGLFDWMLKTRSKGFALSLSGGADSALCAVSVAVGQALALEHLGDKKYVEILRSLNIDVKDVEGDHETYIKTEVMPKVLTTVYQASKSSGKITRNAAEKLAACLGSTHHELEISKAVDLYIKLFDKANDGPSLSWEKDDLTLQNIQARSRLPSIWMFANRENKLLLSTGNLSEAVVGYCTMDGDTVGGVDPVGGIGKSRILRINRQIADHGVNLGPSAYIFNIKDLSFVADQEPTAELRPGGEQKDEKDLMPYILLDEIRRLFNAEFLGPEEIFSKVRADERFKDLDDDLLKSDVAKYFRLNARSQWKRKRFASSFHIEKDSCDMWSLPILNDSFNCLL